MIGIKDVAKDCETSISTVSNVINGTKYVSPELEERIKRSIARLGYEVNPFGRGLKSKKTSTIGVIITSIDRIFFTRVLKGIQEVMLSHGYKMTFCSSNDSVEQEQAFYHMLCNNLVDGIIIDSVSTPEQGRWYTAMDKISKNKKRIPVVNLETRLDCFGTDSVGIDNKKAAMDATDCLIKAGCQKVVHIAGVPGSPLSGERMKGFAESAGSRNCGVEAGDFSPNSGYNAMARLLGRGILPDGLFAANDQMAVGALQALVERGLRVPEDVKVIGFDDTFVASIVSPALSTVHVPKYRMGTGAAEQLLRRINGDEGPWQHIELPYELITRRSTGHDAEPGSWDMARW
jgi:LacI family transcriptional regulator